jgi:hypothetical protein
MTLPLSPNYTTLNNMIITCIAVSFMLYNIRQILPCYVTKWMQINYNYNYNYSYKELEQ